MDKKITFNFWRIEMPSNENRLFGSFIQLAVDMESIEERTLDLSNYPVRMERAELHNDLWFGEMLKIRMNEIPVKAGLDTPIQDLGLDNDEGVAEPNGFLFDTRTSVLITHGEHFGVSAAKIAEYFGEIGTVRGPIHVEPVPTEEGWEKFNSMGRVKGLVFRLGRAIDPSLIPGEGGLKRMIQHLGSYQGIQMEISVSVGRAQNTELNRETTTSDISALLACYDENNNAVEKLEGKGTNSDGKTETFNFLEGRMKYSALVSLGHQRRLTFESRRRHLRDAYLSNVDEIHCLYPVNLEDE